MPYVYCIYIRFNGIFLLKLESLRHAPLIRYVWNAACMLFVLQCCSVALTNLHCIAQKFDKENFDR